jgi:hypothetical protein
MFIRGEEMKYKISILSGNVKEHDQNRKGMEKIFKEIKTSEPSLFILHEVTGSMVYHDLRMEFPDYVYEIFKGPQPHQENLIGCRKDLDEIPMSILEDALRDSDLEIDEEIIFDLVYKLRNGKRSFNLLDLLKQFIPHPREKDPTNETKEDIEIPLNNMNKIPQ